MGLTGESDALFMVITVLAAIVIVGLLFYFTRNQRNNP
ncbi:MAG: LPXTG cell wall anchor domain-containing protein [Chloroflexi bacterium]|nr:LPXTG cell wall anchor domain-containing protein [Chloroflexota bacterium]